MCHDAIGRDPVRAFMSARPRPSPEEVETLKKVWQVICQRIYAQN